MAKKVYKKWYKKRYSIDEKMDYYRDMFFKASDPERRAYYKRRYQQLMDSRY